MSAQRFSRNEQCEQQQRRRWHLVARVGHCCPWREWARTDRNLQPPAGRGDPAMISGCMRGEFLPAMLPAIDTAREYVLLEMYLVRLERHRDALHRRPRPGARAAVCAVCFVRWFRCPALAARGPPQPHDGGAELRFFNPLRLRKGFAQSAARSPQAAADRRPGRPMSVVRDSRGVRTRRARSPWRDVMVEIKGPVVADWQRAFARLAALRRTSRTRIRPACPRSLKEPSAGCHCARPASAPCSPTASCGASTAPRRACGS